MAGAAEHEQGPSQSRKAEQKDEIPDRTAADTNSPADVQEPSKNALKKAAKQEKLAAEKASKQQNKSSKEIGKSEAKKGSNAAPKKATDGPLISINATKEDDFSSWYQQVLTKGDMLDYYDVSGCYILKVSCEAGGSKSVDSALTASSLPHILFGSRYRTGSTRR